MFDSLAPSGGKNFSSPHLTGTVEAAAQEVASHLRSLAHQGLVVGREGFCKMTRTLLHESLSLALYSLL